MKSTLLRLALSISLVATAVTATRADAAEPGVGELRYLVTLKAGANPADVAAAGATVEAVNGSSLTVTIPAVAAARLADLPGVASLVELTGESQAQLALPATSAPPARLAPRKAAPLGTQTLWATGQYVYDGAGNITGIGTTSSPNSDGKTSTFSYDEASRLIEASIGRTGPDIHETYQYDGFGNLTAHTRTSPGTTITYPSAGNLPSLITNRMTGTDTGYDDAGNVTAYGGTTLTYDAFNQATSKTLNSYTYNYLYDVNEERIGIQSGSTSHWTIRDFDNKPLLQFDSSLSLNDASWASTQWSWVESYVWSDERMLAAERPSGQIHYHLDHLGSPRILTDGSGTQIGDPIEYAPYGEEISTPGGEVLKFTGHERDYDPGNPANDNYLDYMHARYYDARMGRFLAVDPVLGHTLQPQSWNRYAYVLNDPIVRIDRDGRDWRKELQGIVGLGLVLTGVHEVDTGKPAGWPAGAKYVHDAIASVPDQVKMAIAAGPFLTVEGPPVTYQTYIKVNEETGQTYSGRTSGTGTPEQNVARRDAGHHMNEQGYGPAELDKTATDKDAIRGREQQNIDANGGAQSQGGTSGNAINGISPKNPKLQKYIEAAMKLFGAI